ncbi:MAG: hypothetical protein AAF658_17140 [Myxococcota bacterium]
MNPIGTRIPVRVDTASSGGACGTKEVCGGCTVKSGCSTGSAFDGFSPFKDWPDHAWEHLETSIRIRNMTLSVGGYPFPASKESEDALVRAVKSVMGTPGIVKNPRDINAIAKTADEMLPAVAASLILKNEAPRNVFPLLGPQHVRTLAKRDQPVVMITMPTNPTQKQVDALFSTARLLAKLSENKEFKSPVLGIAFAEEPFPEDIVGTITELHGEQADGKSGQTKPAPFSAFFFGSGLSHAEPFDAEHLPKTGREHPLVAEWVEYLASRV